MLIVAAIRILCENDPSLGTAVVNGILGSATALGGCTALGAGLPAALFAFDDTRAAIRADLINRGIGCGFIAGIAMGLLTLIVFSAKVVS